MAPKNLAQLLKDQIECASQFDDQTTRVVIHKDGTEKFVKALVETEVEGSIRTLEVWIRDMGLSEPITIR